MENSYTMKILLSILIVLIALFLVFYFWASSPNLAGDQLTEVKEYANFSPPGADRIFSVITYNIGYLSGMTNQKPVRPEEGFYKDNMKKVVAGLKQQSPDLIAFQEIDFYSNRSYYVDQAKEIAHKLAFRYAAKAVNWDKKYVPFPYFPPRVQYGRMLSGQAILSRFPILKQERIVLEKVAAHPFWYNAFYLDRLLQIVEMEIHGRKVILMNVHLEAFDRETRKLQTEFVHKKFQEFAKNYPVLMIGDFNSHPSHKENPTPTIQPLLNDPDIGSACPPADYNSPDTFTFPSIRPIEKIDYIFFNKSKIEALEYKVLHDFGQASDHLPVWMKCILK